MSALQHTRDTRSWANVQRNCLGRRSLRPVLHKTPLRTLTRGGSTSSGRPGRLEVSDSRVSSATGSAVVLEEQRSAVHRFVVAFNARDLEGMMKLLSQDCCYHNLGYLQPQMGQEEVRHMFQNLLAATPSDWRLLIDDSTAPGATGALRAHSVAISWHMEARGKTLPLLSGLSFYKINDQGKICYIKEAAEQAVKLPPPATQLLGGIAPFLEMLAAPAATALSAVSPAAPGSGTSSSGLPPSASPGRSSSTTPAPSGVPPQGRTLPSERLDATDSQAGSQMTASTPAATTTTGSTGASSSSARRGQPGASLAGIPAGSIGSLWGIWLKDSAASDIASYERALQLMQIGGLQRTTAVQLLEGVELAQEGDTVMLRFLTVVPFFKITETYSLASPTKMQRRDLKAGMQQAVAAVPASGEMAVDISWEAPNPGSILERYRVDSSGRLEITATVKVAGGTEVTRQVYTRADRWSPRFKWPPGGLFGSP